jgi:hypothetical protein
MAHKAISKKRGFRESIGLAAGIARGSLRLLKLHPVLIMPLMPIFLGILALEFSLLSVESALDILVAWLLVGLLAFGLLFAFAVTSTMLRQIHEGKKPSLGDATTSSQLWSMVPRLLLLAGGWYTLVLIIVSIELLISVLLDKIDEDGKLAARVNRAIFGTVGDALRLMAFMMIPIMVFENVGLRAAFRRLKATLQDSPISALAGLALTKLVTGIIALLVWGTLTLIQSAEAQALTVVIGLPAVAAGWFLSIYLEQLFVTGLYLYTALPSSPLVPLLLERQLGRELPWTPAPEAA